MFKTQIRRSIAANATAAIAKATAECPDTFGMSLLQDVVTQPAVLVSDVGSDIVSLQFPFTVTKGATNKYAALHGGAFAALADVFTTAHLWGLQPTSSHVSVDFNIQYSAGAPMGSRVVCVTDVPKAGARLAFTKFSFRSADGKILYAEGTHTKAILKK